MGDGGNYRTETGYDTAALSDINHILRDWRTGEINVIAPALLDDIYDIQRRLRHHGVINIISGYRSPKTNAALSHKSRGVAKRIHGKNELRRHRPSLSG